MDEITRHLKFARHHFDCTEVGSPQINLRWSSPYPVTLDPIRRALRMGQIMDSRPVRLSPDPSLRWRFMQRTTEIIWKRAR